QYLKESGVADEMVIGPEFEFYVFDSARFEADEHRASFAVDTVEGHWNSAAQNYGNGVQVPKKGGYHIDLPADSTYDLRSNICMLLEDWGVKVKYHHHEVGGCGQLEVEVELGEIVKMADSTMAAKYIIKNAARREGRTATFMPKPLAGVAGSGMHVHMLLTKDGKPVFYDEAGYAHLSETALYFIGGLLKHAASLCALTNPSTNSFKRLVPGFEAPVTIGYAMANRSAVVRIPSYAKSPMHKRFELRNPDATCNPYYAYAAILMAGLDGIRERIDPHANGWGPYDFNLFDLPEAEKAKIGGLPKTLDEALDALERDHEYLTRGGVFPERLIGLWIEKKRAEAAELARIPNPAEYVKYYDL
ncbi:MAG: type I glutamate--ammonia ligase, partial [Eubacteriales bacterium]|nr:type I glutamate--ammonia ligase [Eubacteriales bacterium]